MNQLSSCIDFVVGIVGGNCWREPKFTFDTFDHSDEDTFDQLTNMKFNFYKINFVWNCWRGPKFTLAGSRIAE